MPGSDKKRRETGDSTSCGRNNCWVAGKSSKSRAGRTKNNRKTNSEQKKANHSTKRQNLALRQGKKERKKEKKLSLTAKHTKHVDALSVTTSPNSRREV